MLCNQINDLVQVLENPGRESDSDEYFSLRDNGGNKMRDNLIISPILWLSMCYK